MPSTSHWCKFQTSLLQCLKGAAESWQRKTAPTHAIVLRWVAGSMSQNSLAHKPVRGCLPLRRKNTEDPTQPASQPAMRSFEASPWCFKVGVPSTPHSSHLDLPPPAQSTSATRMLGCSEYSSRKEKCDFTRTHLGWCAGKRTWSVSPCLGDPTWVLTNGI